MRNSFHTSQELVLVEGGYDFAMPTKNDFPLQNIRENMLRLMEARRMLHESGKHAGEPNHRALAQKAHVDPKTVGNLLNPEWDKSPLLKVVEAIAAALGVTTWQLCMPNLTTNRDANELLAEGIEEDVYQMAAVYQTMDQAARERVKAVLAFVTAHPDAITPSDLLQALRKAD